MNELTNRELLSALLCFAADTEFWSDHGTYGDGKYEEAKANLKRVKRLVLERMNKGESL